MTETGLWTPDHGLPDGARAREWLREQRRREQYRWRSVRDRRVDRLIEAAAPTLQSYTETASWMTTGASKSLGSISWTSGDILVCIAGAANNDTLGVPTNTGSGLTWTSRQVNTTVSTCGTRLATAAVSASSSGIISVANTGGHRWGFAVWRWSGSTGIGNSIEQHSSTKTKALTITSVNSAVMCGVFDFNADGAGSGTPAVTNTRQSAQDPGQYTLLVFDNIDYSTSGSLWGQTGGGSTGPFSIVAMEILNGGGGGGRGLFRAPTLSGTAIGGSFFGDPLSSAPRMAA